MNSLLGTMAENGTMFGFAGGTIQERCVTTSPGLSPADVYTVAITAELVSSLNGAKATKPAHLRPLNKFVPPKPIRRGTRRVNATGDRR